MTSVTTNGTTVNRTHNSDNQITNIGAATLTYDSNGNLTTDDSGDTLVYDAWNRLVEIKNSGGFLLKAYTYDGLGRRVTETDGYTVTDSFFNTRWQLLEEKSASTIIAQYMWSAVYVDALVYRTGAGGNYLATYDANFNVTGIENSGTVAERFLYTSYGKRTDLNSSWSSSADSKNWVIGWQGMRWDSAAGLFYQRNRWYSPSLMRWITWDPIGYGDGMNPMLMEAANPINRTDWSGLAAASQPAKYDRIAVLKTGKIDPNKPDLKSIEGYISGTTGVKGLQFIHVDSLGSKIKGNVITRNPDAYAQSGFTIAYRINGKAGKNTSEGGATCDFSESYAYFMAWSVIWSPGQLDNEYYVTDAGKRVREYPYDVEQHESWHTDGTTVHIPGEDKPFTILGSAGEAKLLFDKAREQLKDLESGKTATGIPRTAPFTDEQANSLVQNIFKTYITGDSAIYQMWAAGAWHAREHIFSPAPLRPIPGAAQPDGKW